MLAERPDCRHERMFTEFRSLRLMADSLETPAHVSKSKTLHSPMRNDVCRGRPEGRGQWERAGRERESVILGKKLLISEVKLYFAN